MMYFKSLDFPIHLMAYWWLLWLGISYSPLNEFLAPSYASLGQFLLLIVGFLFGHMTMKRWRPHNPQIAVAAARGLKLRTRRVRWVLTLAGFGSLLMLLQSLKMAGAFELDFIDYFEKVRLSGGASDTVTEVTGIHTLDVLTKILAFPLAYTILVTVLAIELSGLRMVFFVSLVSFVCFSYLWQINYPLIHLFWLMVFYVLVTAQRRGRFNRMILGMATIICIGLMASAANRFGGGDVLGGLQRYFFGYHLVGFSFYDRHYLDPNSILHTYSFGRSSLGFLELVLEKILKPFSIGFQAVSSENAEFTNSVIDIGARELKEFNAFGTIVFTLYRDFNLVGIFLGSFFYGAAATYAHYRSHTSWRHGALFLMLASAWMMGMMVSPLEAAYFWFVVVTLGLLQIVNRGVRW